LTDKTDPALRDGFLSVKISLIRFICVLFSPHSTLHISTPTNPCTLFGTLLNCSTRVPNFPSVFSITTKSIHRIMTSFHLFLMPLWMRGSPLEQVQRCRNPLMSSLHDGCDILSCASVSHIARMCFDCIFEFLYDGEILWLAWRIILISSEKSKPKRHKFLKCEKDRTVRNGAIGATVHEDADSSFAGQS